LSLSAGAAGGGEPIGSCCGTMVIPIGDVNLKVGTEHSHLPNIKINIGGGRGTIGKHTCP